MVTGVSWSLSQQSLCEGRVASWMRGRDCTGIHSLVKMTKFTISVKDQKQYVIDPDIFVGFSPIITTITTTVAS